jgi:Fe-S-cluster containining protein
LRRTPEGEGLVEGRKEKKEALAALGGLYRELGEATARLDRIHGTRIRCARTCTSCCVDGITVFEIEAERIRRNCAALLRGDAPHEPGMCAFLDEGGACRIYEHRPYVCRTQGYPLRWVDEERNSVVERRDICPLNEDGPPIESLPADHCWTLGPTEGRLASLQAAFQADPLAHALRRIPLRDLFPHP